MDMITDLPISNGYDSILAVVDHGGNSYPMFQDFDGCSMRWIIIGQCLQKIWTDGQDYFRQRTTIHGKIILGASEIAQNQIIFDNSLPSSI